MNKNKRTSKNKTDGLRNLSAAVKQVHNRGRGDVEQISERLLLGPGDELGRSSYFDHNERKSPIQSGGKRVHMVMRPKAALYDYRTREGKRTHRSMITVPPKLRENIRACFGAADDSDVPMTTAIIALADYAAMLLLRDKQCLIVEAAEDRFSEERKAARKAIRKAAIKR